MRDVHLRQVDLNLLSTLYALLEERHVTRAAKRCFLSQPAMSRSLERIRDTFGDELLIRTGRIYDAGEEQSGALRPSCFHTTLGLRCNDTTGVVDERFLRTALGRHYEPRIFPKGP